jgi:Fe-S-cluster containining protein
MSKVPICNIENMAKKIMPEIDEELLIFLLKMRAQLTFQCKRCGNCCQRLIVRVDDTDIKRLVDNLGFPTHKIKREYIRKFDNGYALRHKQQPNRPCKFYDSINKKCKVYDARPKTCILFPFLSRSTIHANMKCPGSRRTVELLKDLINNPSEFKKTIALVEAWVCNAVKTCPEESWEYQIACKSSIIFILANVFYLFH